MTKGSEQTFEEPLAQLGGEAEMRAIVEKHGKENCTRQHHSVVER